MAWQVKDPAVTVLLAAKSPHLARVAGCLPAGLLLLRQREVEAQQAAQYFVFIAPGVLRPAIARADGGVEALVQFAQLDDERAVLRGQAADHVEALVVGVALGAPHFSAGVYIQRLGQVGPRFFHAHALAGDVQLWAQRGCLYLSCLRRRLLYAPAQVAHDAAYLTLKPGGCADAAFPHRQHTPAQRAQLAVGTAVAALVTGELFLPVRAPGFRDVPVIASVSVPEAAAHLDGGAVLREDDVGFSR